MALKYGNQRAVSYEAMEQVFPMVLDDMARRMLRDLRPDWDTFVVTIDRDSGMFRDDLWLVRLRCQGGRRDCQVRGG